jgi:thioredoxin 1
MVTELNTENFDQNIASGLTIVDFWASWCGPCKMMAPIFDEVSSEYEGKLKFAKISTEDHPDVAGKQGITGIPCFIIFKDGQEVDRIIGAAPKDGFKSKIDAVLSKA